MNSEGERADFIEVRNIGDVPVSLDGLALRDSAFDSAESLSLTGVLAPGEHRAFFAGESGGLPFGMGGGGDSIWMVGIDDIGVATVLEKVRPPESGAGASWSRLGAGGDFVNVGPIPGAANVPAGEMYIGPAPEGGMIRLGVSASRGSNPVIEMLLPGADWIATDPMTGDGYKLVVDVPRAADTALFRVREKRSADLQSASQAGHVHAGRIANPRSRSG